MLLLRNQSWRLVFVAGIAPAFVALLVRCWVKEPERWVKAHQQECQTRGPRPSKLLELFKPGRRRATLVGSGLAFVAVFGLWGATNWTPELVRSLPDLKGLAPVALTSRVSWAAMMYCQCSLESCLEWFWVACQLSCPACLLRSGWGWPEDL